MIYCGKCGGRMSTKFKHSDKYKCANCESDIVIPLCTLYNLVHSAKALIIEKRDNQAVYNYNETPEIIKADDDIGAMISTKSADCNYIRQMIFENAALKYRSISESPKEELKFEISELESFKLRRKDKPQMCDIELLFEATEQVIADEKSIRIILKRGEQNGNRY
jgi:hypothetical protein